LRSDIGQTSGFPRTRTKDENEFLSSECGFI
jgi:hypothetical protein